MSNPSSALPLHQRLGEQLQALSQVSETLTVRLLELEERVVEIEHRFERLLDEARLEGEPGPGTTSEMLALTEERIARLEELLEGTPVAAVRSAPSVLPFPRTEGHRSVNDAAEGEFAADPFPEEEEQHFMDELSA